MKLIPSAVLQAEVPAPLTVNVPLVLLPLPASPTEPISRSVQTGEELDWDETVTKIVVVCIRLADVPAMVTAAVPVVAVLLATRVRVLVAVAGFGLNEAVTPLGRPATDKLTLPLKPFWGVTVMVLVPLVPKMRVRLLGDAESAKFGEEGVVTTTLSKVAVARVEVLPLLTTSPT